MSMGGMSELCIAHESRIAAIEGFASSHEDRLKSVEKITYMLIGGASMGGFIGGILGSLLIGWVLK